MRPGDLLWLRATIVAVTPKALLVSLQGPGGAPVTYAVDPNGVMLPYHRSPEPQDETKSI